MTCGEVFCRLNVVESAVESITSTCNRRCTAGQAESTGVGVIVIVVVTGPIPKVSAFNITFVSQLLSKLAPPFEGPGILKYDNPPATLHAVSVLLRLLISASGNS